MGVWEEILIFLENQLDEALGKEAEEKEEANLLQEREETSACYKKVSTRR